MKKLFIAALMLAVIFTLALPVYATDTEPVDEVTQTTEPELTAPTEEQIESGVTELVDELDKSLAGIDIWEQAKEWILTNLSTVVGALTAFAALVFGLMTKFSFLPKISGIIQQFGGAIHEWYSDNTDKVKGLVQSMSDFLTEMRQIIKTVAKQSEENKRLLEENARLYREYIEVRSQTNLVERAMLEYAKLSAEEFEDLIQTSDLPKADLDRHYDAYKAKTGIIEAAITEREENNGEEAEL